MPATFNFPQDIKLKKSPLIEAWLEIRWQLVSDNDNQFLRDPGFPFALGAFYNGIKAQYGHREDLDASHAPDEMLPYVVRHRFRPAADQWPVLQLGPGITTLNLVGNYSWRSFNDLALYLREKLIEAYGETELKLETIALKYRNGEPFEHSANNPFDFLKQKLNISVELPAHVPGFVSPLAYPSNININSAFELTTPRGVGAIRLATGRVGKAPDQYNEFLFWELGVSSNQADAPPLDNEPDFINWLTAAHAVIHEWFFSLVDGPLLQKYQTGEE